MFPYLRSMTLCTLSHIWILNYLLLALGKFIHISKLSIELRSLQAAILFVLSVLCSNMRLVCGLWWRESGVEVCTWDVHRWASSKVQNACARWYLTDYRNSLDLLCWLWVSLLSRQRFTLDKNLLLFCEVPQPNLPWNIFMKECPASILFS